MTKTWRSEGHTSAASLRVLARKSSDRTLERGVTNSGQPGRKGIRILRRLGSQGWTTHNTSSQKHRYRRRWHMTAHANCSGVKECMFAMTLRTSQPHPLPHTNGETSSQSQNARPPSDRKVLSIECHTMSTCDTHAVHSGSILGNLNRHALHLSGGFRS